MPGRRDREAVILMKKDKKGILIVSKNNEAKVLMWVLPRKSVGGVRLKEVDVVLSSFDKFLCGYSF